MVQVVEIDPREITITPIFKVMEIENVPKSEKAGHAVMEMKEVVEVRFAGSKNYSPVFPANGFWKRENNNIITYAERWADQYKTFKEGLPQEANGTPLQMLAPYGMTPEMISMCRALKIYSIEALYHLEGDNLKSLGMASNKLKDLARRFMADRNKGDAATKEIAALRAELELLKERSTVPPENEATPAEIDDAVQASDDAFSEMTDEQLKESIALLAGSRPRGTPSRATLVNMLTELKAG